MLTPSRSKILWFLVPVLPLLLAAEKPAETRSVWEGVYTAEQVARGKRGYNAECARCHGENLLGGEDSPALVDKDFLKGWNGKTVGELVDVTVETMPSDGPGKLSRRQCTDITAFVLSANGFPTGARELPSDAAILARIIIEPKK